MGPEGKAIGRSAGLLATRPPGASEMGAGERVPADALAGDATPVAWEDHVEEAWRIVNPVPKARAPVQGYEPNTGGRLRLTGMLYLPVAGGTPRRLVARKWRHSRED
jgi:hypothetical protein